MNKKSEQDIIAEAIDTLFIENSAPKSKHIELSELKAKIKPLGFKVSTKSLSHGRHATFHHEESGRALTGNVFTPETAKVWKPLIDVLRDYDGITHNGEKVAGIKAGR
jgi:hypothetical protein